MIKETHKKYFLFLILSLLLFGGTIQAQQYSVIGTVVNQDKYPIEFVTASILKNEILVEQTFSDSLGVFTFSVEKGEYSLILEQFGVESIRKELEVNQNLDLGELEIDESIMLEGVTITANKRIIERSFDKLIFNVENSPLKQGYNGLEVLKRSPGLRVNSQGDLLLRNESVLVMVNGRKMNFSAEELSNYLNSINSETIKSIEIQNLGSAETEASNSGGVINIVLKKIPVGFQSTIRTSYTYRDKDHAGYLGNITNQFGSEKWNIYNKLNYTDNSNLSKFNSVTNFYDFDGKNKNAGESDNHNKNFNTTTGVVYYPSYRHEVGAEFYFSHSKIDRNGWEDLEVYDPILSAMSNNKSIYYNKNNFWNVALNYTYKLDSIGSRLKFIGDIGNNNLDNRNDVDSRYSFGSLPNNYNRFLTDAKSNFFNLQTDWLQKLKNQWEFTAGIKLSKVSRENLLNNYLYDGNWNPTNGNQNFENDESILSNYATIAKKWDEKHNLKIGLRTEYTTIKGIDYINNSSVKKNYMDWFPSVYYSYDVKESQAISISYSRRIFRPSFRDLNPFVIKQNDFLYQMGNPDLQPQYTNKIDLSYQLKDQRFSVYGSFTNDLIAGVYTVNDNVSYYKPENFGKSRNIGFDYSYYGNITKWLYANISTGVWNYDFELERSKHNRFSFYNTISMQVKFSKTFFLDITNDFTTKSQYHVVEFYPQYGLDLALQKSIFSGSGIIRLSIDDVFNTQRNKNVSQYENFNFHFYSKSITRVPILTFTYNIKNNNKINNKNVQKTNDNINRL